MGRPKKHSVTLRGHRTSISLEDEFWREFCDIAAERGLAINELAAEIDEGRTLESGLASEIRLYVLRYYQRKSQATSP